MKKKKTIIDESEDTERLEERDLPPADALSSAEVTMLRAAVRQGGEDRSQLPPHDSSDRAQIARFAKKNRAVSAAIIVIAIALIAGLILGGVLFFSWLANRPNKADFTVNLGENKPVTVPYGHLVRDGVLYVDMRQIASYAGLTVSGSPQSKLRFTGTNNSYLQFEHDSEFALINGDQVEIYVSMHTKDKDTVAKVYMEDGQCLVPYRFLTRAVSSGLLFRMDEKTNTITVQRKYLPTEDEDDPKIGADLLFNSSRFTVIPPETEPPKYLYYYMTDITPYLENIEKEYLLLANKEHPLTEKDAPSDLTRLNCKTASNRTLYLRADAARALEAMMNEMLAAGIEDVSVTSAYRTYERQKELYFTTYYNQEKAKHPDWTDEQIFAEVSTYSAYPGTSEHQTGLCIDFITSTMRELTNEFENTEAFAWLRDNAHQFGFILRYPKDKVDVTQYSYESWHFRFVGREAASDIFFGDLCLEEYLAGKEVNEP